MKVKFQLVSASRSHAYNGNNTKVFVSVVAVEGGKNFMERDPEEASGLFTYSLPENVSAKCEEVFGTTDISEIASIDPSVLEMMETMSVPNKSVFNGRSHYVNISEDMMEELNDAGNALIVEMEVDSEVSSIVTTLKNGESNFSMTFDAQSIVSIVKAKTGVSKAGLGQKQSNKSRIEGRRENIKQRSEDNAEAKTNRRKLKRLGSGSFNQNAGTPMDISI